jgi:hypothetical protein
MAVSTDLLIRAGHDQAETSHPLLDLHWLDVSSMPLEDGAALTADDALARELADQWEASYRAWIDHVQATHPEATVDPWDETKRVHLDMKAQGLATGRLDQYEQRLRAFLQTEPSEDALATWLADRAITDASVWARLDAAEIRQEAQDDFYAANPELHTKTYSVEPGEAVCDACEAIAGGVFDSYGEANDALDDAWHYNCQHYIAVVD